MSDLDFAPSRGNTVFGNAVRGPHYAGISYGAGSTGNDVFDNTVFGADHWAPGAGAAATEQQRQQFDKLPSRNIDAGFDPNLPALGKGRFDGPASK